MSYQRVKFDQLTKPQQEHLIRLSRPSDGIPEHHPLCEYNHKTIKKLVELRLVEEYYHGINCVRLAFDGYMVLEG